MSPCIAVVKQRANENRLTELRNLHDQIEAMDEDDLLDHGQLDAALGMVGKAASEQGERITLHLRSADGSRACSVGIRTRSRLTKLMEKYASMLPRNGERVMAASDLTFEWSGQRLSPDDVVEEVGLFDGATIKVIID
eukprot:SAG31_NODE_7442_length_1688_cov_1.455003_1_plen_138_part_00